MAIHFGSRNLGLSTIHSAGTKIKAPIKQARIDTNTKNPKNRTGKKFETNNALNPIITDNALKVIPLPVVVKVFLTAST